MMKIAVFCSPNLQGMFKQIAAEQKLSSCFVYWLYDDFEEMEELYERGKETVRGILFTGDVPLNYFQLMHPECKLPMIQVKNNDLLHACLRLLRHQTQNPHVPLNQVFCDFLGDVKTYALFSQVIPPEQLPYTFMTPSLSSDFFSDLAESVKELYHQGKIKKAILTLSSLYSKLYEEGIPCEFVPIQPENVAAALHDIVQIVDGMGNHQQGLAVLLIDYTHVDGIDYSPTEAEFREITLLKVLVDYKRTLPEEISLGITRGASTVELVMTVPADREPLDLVTECLDILKESYPYAFSTGIGLGGEMRECRQSALSALNISKGFGKGFAFSQHHSQLIGPLQRDSCLEMDLSLLASTSGNARRLGINNLNFVRLLALFARQPVISSEQVGEYLNVTGRSATRILAHLEEHGVVQQVAPPEPQLARKGRPTKYFTLINSVKIC